MTDDRVARLAIRSLYAELTLYPKPGLVSLRDCGAHTDMDAATFVRSARSLRGYFAAIAAAGMRTAVFEPLRCLGLAAEERMLRATGGVNTHRGAIFTLGLFAAGAGAALAERRSLSDAALREFAGTRWSRDLAAHASQLHRSSHGQMVAARYGVAGARGEAALGFPSVFEISLPALREALGGGADEEGAQMHALFSLLARVNDTNVLYRRGLPGLESLQRGARDFLVKGSVFAPDWKVRALALHRMCRAARISPGGSADLFAATWFVHLLQTQLG